MPAPDRELPKQSFTTSVAVPKGLWGYYTDREVDALIAAIPTGGGLQTIDLSAYATTAYVDGKVATLYTKAEVDAAIKAAAEESALDLDAVRNQVLFAATEIGRQLQEKIDLKADQGTTYTKAEVDAAVGLKADVVNADQWITARGVEVTGVRFEELGGARGKANLLYTVAVPNDGPRLGLSIDGKAPMPYAYLSDVQAAVAAIQLPASAVVTHTDKPPQFLPTQTPHEVLAAWSAYPTGVHRFDGGLAVVTRNTVTGTTDTQAGTKPFTTDTLAVSLTLEGRGMVTLDVQESTVDGKHVPVNSRAVVWFGGDWFTTQASQGDQAFGTPSAVNLFALQGGAAADLSTYAKVNDPEQMLTAKSLVAQAVAFDNAQQVMKIHDTGEGYGPRLSWITAAQGGGVSVDPIVLKTDLEPLNALVPKVNAMVEESAAMAAKVTRLTIESDPTSAPSINDPALAEFKASVLEEVRRMMAGGKEVPADLPWTPCTKVLGSGLIEARVLNGMIQLRGELVYTMTNIGSFMTVQRLPADFPKPPQEQNVVVFGYENQVAYRRVFLRFNTDGTIGICGDGKITHTSMGGAQAYAY